MPPPLQLISTCADRMRSGNVRLNLMLSLSDSDEVVPNAQQDPQSVARTRASAFNQLLQHSVSHFSNDWHGKAKGTATAGAT